MVNVLMAMGSMLPGSVVPPSQSPIPVVRPSRWICAIARIDNRWDSIKHSPPPRRQVQDLEDKVFVADAFGGCLDADIAVTGRQPGQGIDFH